MAQINTPRCPDISVVICAHDEQKYLPQTLAALQTVLARTRYKLEILGVDNNSSDATPAIFARHNIKTIHEKKQGISYARQTGLEAARGELVLMTDADTLAYPPEWINKHISYYNDADVVEVAGSCEFSDLHPLFIWLRSRQLSKKINNVMGAPKPEPEILQPPVGMGTNLSYRRRQALAVGYEPGSDKGEDSIMWKKLQAMGKAVADHSPDLSVLTSGRRFNTALRVAEFCLSDLKRKLIRTLTGEPNPSKLRFKNKR